MVKKDRQKSGSVWEGNRKEDYSTKSSVLYLFLQRFSEIILHRSSIAIVPLL